MLGFQVFEWSSFWQVEATNLIYTWATLGGDFCVRGDLLQWFTGRVAASCP